MLRRTLCFGPGQNRRTWSAVQPQHDRVRAIPAPDLYPLRNAADLNVTGFVNRRGRFERLLFGEQRS